MNHPRIDSPTRPPRRVGFFVPAFRAFVLALLLASAPAHGDLVDTVDRGTLAGTVTLTDDGQLRITPEAGEPVVIPPYDAFQINFGKGLVLRNGDLLLIDNDGVHQSRPRSQAIRLRAGLHHIVLPYWQGDGAGSIELRVAGPGFNAAQTIPTESLFTTRRSDDPLPESGGVDGEGYRMPELPLSAIADREVRSRVRYSFYSAENASNWRDMGCFTQMQLQRRGTIPEIADHANGGQTEWFGLVFEGFIKIDEDGEYTFTLVSDDGSRLYFGQPEQFNASLPISVGPAPMRVLLKQGGELRGEFAGLDEQLFNLAVPIGEEQIEHLPLGIEQVAELWPTEFDLSTIDRSNEPADQDTAYVRGKDDPADIRPISGQITAMDAVSLTIVFRGQPRQLNRDRIVGLVLNHADRPAPPKPGFHQVLALRTGQEIPGHLVTLTDQTLGFKLFGGTTIDVPRDSVAFLRYEQGRVVDLTRIEPTAAEDIPYFDTAYPYQVNHALGGGELRLYDGKTYDRGLAVHSLSRLYYRLDGQYTGFRATLGLLDPGGRLGNITARVLGDGKVIWEQANITTETRAIDLDLDLTGVQRLVLEVDFGEGQNVGDRAAWCNPQLIRETVAE